jgi:hypothetical protein
MAERKADLMPEEAEEENSPKRRAGEKQAGRAAKSS